MSPPPKVLVITGTTASGKGDVGAALAVRVSGEVLSLDSMKVYRGMDIGTSKPTEAERLGAPHHLIDLVDPQESMNLARFIDLAHQARVDVGSRGRVPVVVGGTMLYLHGFLHGVFEGPAADFPFRERLRAEAREAGVPALHARLQAVDAAAAARIHAHDYRRIERALEVHALTGRPISVLRREGTRPIPFEREIRVLTFRRDVLDARIDARVIAMFEMGLIGEVERILGGRGFGRESGQALGYREVVEHLEGLRSRDETIALVQKRTRLFARRQLTWLRKLADAVVHELEAASELAGVVDQISGGRTDRTDRTART